MFEALGKLSSRQGHEKYDPEVAMSLLGTSRSVTLEEPRGEDSIKSPVSQVHLHRSLGLFPKCAKAPRKFEVDNDLICVNRGVP